MMHQSAFFIYFIIRFHIHPKKNTYEHVKTYHCLFK